MSTGLKTGGRVFRAGGTAGAKVPRWHHISNLERRSVPPEWSEHDCWSAVYRFLP